MKSGSLLDLINRKKRRKSKSKHRYDKYVAKRKKTESLITDFSKFIDDDDYDVVNYTKVTTDVYPKDDNCDCDKCNCKMKGGKADGKSPDDYNQKQLEIGKKVQTEHTDDEEIAQKIAMDHLEEHPKYYSTLIDADLADEEDALELYDKYYKKNKQIQKENNIYIKNNPKIMNRLNTTFGKFVNEKATYTELMMKNRDNKFNIIVQFDEDAIDVLESHNITSKGSKTTGDWILYNFLEKTYSILDGKDGEIFQDDKGLSFFTLKGKPETAYRVIDFELLKSMYMSNL